MNYKKITIEIEVGDDLILGEDSRTRLTDYCEEVVKEISEMYSSSIDGNGLVGSGYNFITKERDYKIEVGFNKK